MLGQKQECTGAVRGDRKGNETINNKTRICCPLPVVACKITALMAILRSKLSEAQCANFTVMDVDVAAAALVVTCTCNNQHHIT